MKPNAEHNGPKPRPLWLTRLLLVVLAPLLLPAALAIAMREGWAEFRWELAHAWQDMVRLWRGE
jgi:hypothetical protein